MKKYQCSAIHLLLQKFSNRERNTIQENLGLEATREELLSMKGIISPSECITYYASDFYARVNFAMEWEMLMDPIALSLAVVVE
jgi:hypothetical protein